MGDGLLAWQFPYLAGDEAILTYWTDGAWDFVALSKVLPCEILQRISSHFYCLKDGSQDAMLWSDTASGCFKISFMVKFIAPASALSWLSKYVWVNGPPLKFSFLLW